MGHTEVGDLYFCALQSEFAKSIFSQHQQEPDLQSSYFLPIEKGHTLRRQLCRTPRVLALPFSRKDPRVLPLYPALPERCRLQTHRKESACRF